MEWRKYGIIVYKERGEKKTIEDAKKSGPESKWGWNNVQAKIHELCDIFILTLSIFGSERKRKILL